MKNLEIAIIGCGQRGKDVYGNMLRDTFSDEITVKAIAEPRQKAREYMKKIHNIDDKYVFKCWSELLAQEKICDAVLISTNDELHFQPFEAALEKGYHILIEKPMTNKREEIDKMEALSKKYSDRIIMVGHVLRYSPFFNKIKDVIDSGEIGRLISIQHSENIGYYHMAHSFVRGNWRNSIETSPIILAKSCHDMDILLYLTSSSCTKISSFASLSYFNKENKPKNAANRCLECKIEKECPYSAKRLYLKNIGNWPTTAITLDQTEEGILKAMRETNYGLCVHDCDNNVMDNQVTIMQFENGVSATFNLTAFTHQISRVIKLMGSTGEIVADMETNKINIYKFLDNKKRVIDISLDSPSMKGHGGGDEKLVADFINLLKNARLGNIKDGKSSVLKSIESHKMAFAAEESRLKNQVIFLNSFK